MYFSIASMPGTRDLELHIQADPYLGSAVQLIEYLRSNRSLRISLPHGNACLTDLPRRPLLLIAAGTGFAQMKSILEYLLGRKFDLPIHLYWGGRRASDLYLTELVHEWMSAHPNLHFHPVIADAKEAPTDGHHEQLAQAILADRLPLTELTTFISGSPNLVFATMKALVTQGLSRTEVYSDVFEYAQGVAESTSSNEMDSG
jgi:CDP-4-dehydro-6-deoxyglucose reductase